MRDRFRTFDSKISFFAFADIITAVSGMLIFITLLLATDLGRPTDSRSQSGDPELERKLQEALAEQAEVDAQNRRQQELLSAVETAPKAEKLQADIDGLRAQLAAEQKKQTTLAAQVSDSRDAVVARDRTLGLTDLKAGIQDARDKTATAEREEAHARGDQNALEQQVVKAQSQLLKLRERDGQLWLIPDRNSTTKEPILVTVDGRGATMERFDRPGERRHLDPDDARAGFQSYLGEAKPLDQYVVFLIRPSGIELFEKLVKLARDSGFDVGFDALEETRQIHFSKPPPLDAPAPPSDVPGPPAKNASTAAGTDFPRNPPPVETPPKAAPPPPARPSAPVAPPKPKGWWERFLTWIGLR